MKRVEQGLDDTLPTITLRDAAILHYIDRNRLEGAEREQMLSALTGRGHIVARFVGLEGDEK